MKMDLYKKINNSKAKYEVFYVIGFILIFFGIYALILQFPAGLISIFCGIVIVVYAKKGYKRVVVKLKATIINSILDEHVENGVYHPFGINSDFIDDSGLLKDEITYTIEDYIEGDLNGVHFISSDIYIEGSLSIYQEETNNNNDFRGRFFQFEFEKDFNGKIFVLEGKMPCFHGYKKVLTDSILFNSVFKTYTNNKSEVFYILTPHFMESLLKLEANHPGNISISFINNKLNIAINNKVDTFECTMFRKYNENLIEEFKSDFLVIIDIINSLKLKRFVRKNKES